MLLRLPDVLAIAALVAFFSIAVVFVRACERIIGPDLEAEASAGDRTPDTGAGAAPPGVAA